MVTIYGMNAKIGNVSFNDSNQEYGFTKPYSESTAEMIDHEVRAIIDECYQKTKQLLIEKRDKLEELSQILLKKEILFQTDLVEILGVRPHDKVEEPVQEAEVLSTSEESSILAEPKQETNTETNLL
jgi:cell division protease FtsH